MDKFIPSYHEYRNIIRDIKKSGKYMDFKSALESDTFIVMRHDIEFSIERAYQMSLIEQEENFYSTYFVQITNNSYNPFSKKNIDLLTEMERMGHHIGLHYHLNGQTEFLDVRDGIRDQIKILKDVTGLHIDRFSIHRPIKEVYYHKINISNIINAYSPEFFTYAENVTEDTLLDVRYITDSKHRWNYGKPTLEKFNKNKKIQILIHPFSWTEEGYDNLNNFKALINEKNDELIQTLDGEFKRFSEIKNEIVDSHISYELESIDINGE